MKNNSQPKLSVQRGSRPERPAEMTHRQASDIVDRVIAKYYHFVPFLTNPTLARATFPDGQRRLAWYELTVVDLSDNAMEGEANVLFVDALTGEPLMLVTDIMLGDPVMGCGWSPNSNRCGFSASTGIPTSVAQHLKVAASSGLSGMYGHPCNLKG